ncbi:MAG: FkbM family methyltransferase [Burkholderiales bacterium]
MSLFGKPDPENLQALAQRLEALEGRLAGMHRLSGIEMDMQCARAIADLLAQPRYGAAGRLERHGWKAWSQNDEDGILHEIFRRIGTATRTFVEFGVSDGRECNSLRLLVEGWSGLWMESGARDCETIRRVFAAPLAEGRLELQETSVTPGNIDLLIGSARVAAAGELDLLSIDIDGNDYHVFHAVESVRPRVVVIEYNAKYPPPMDLVPPYDPQHGWDGSDYMGSSLQALANLGARRGYRLVGTNITGSNAFFVRSELAANHFAEADAAALYNPARYWLTTGYVAGHPPGERFGYTSDAALAAK